MDGATIPHFESRISERAHGINYYFRTFMANGHRAFIFCVKVNYAENIMAAGFYLNSG